MGLYFHRTPSWLKSFYPGLIWNISKNENTIYLTFDDGPVPEVTDYVIGQLKVYGARATFFCVGQNIEKYPRQFERIIKAGHGVANHTFNHLVGWEVSATEYLDNIWKCQEEIEKYVGKQRRKLFRPPHGKITRGQIRQAKKDYEIIMWTYLTGDFDRKLLKEECLSRTIENLRANDILIFHDSIKAQDKMMYTLPQVLYHFTEMGFQFKSI